MMGANYKKPSQKHRFKTHPQFIKGLTKLLKGVLLTIVLIISTIATFLTDNSPYWNDMAFIVWCLCVITLADYFDKK